MKEPPTIALTFPSSCLPNFVVFTMDDKDRKFIRLIGVLSTVGLTLVFATVIGLYVGLKLDAWLGTSPWFTVVFLFIGIAAGFRNLFVYSKRGQETFDKDDKDKS